MGGAGGRGEGDMGPKQWGAQKAGKKEQNDRASETRSRNNAESGRRAAQAYPPKQGHDKPGGNQGGTQKRREQDGKDRGGQEKKKKNGRTSRTKLKPTKSVMKQTRNHLMTTK